MYSLSIITNIVLGISVLMLAFGPRVLKVFKKYKAKRETLKDDKIRRIVDNYLKELQNDT